MSLWGALWIGAGVVALVGFLALFGWYRHKLELEGLQIAGVVQRAYESMAREREEKKRLQDKD